MSGGLSWETMVDQVCVHGRPQRLQDAAAVWDQVSTNAGTVSDSLRQLSGRLQQVWQGQAGDDYRAHLGAVADSVDHVRQQIQKVTNLLNQSASDLQTAQAQMPVPDHMLDQVYNRQQQLDSANRTYGTVALASGTVALAPIAIPLWATAGGANALTGGQFFDSLMSKAGNLSRQTLGLVKDQFDDHTAQARQCYEHIDGRYTQTVSETGSPSSHPDVTGHGTSFDPSGAGAGGHVGGGPSMRSGGTAGGFGGPDASSADAGFTGTSNPTGATDLGTPISGTGLAGADAGGLVGLGTSGIGPASGLGAGGMGSGTSGVSLSEGSPVGGAGGVGRPVTMTGPGGAPILPPGARNAGAGTSRAKPGVLGQRSSKDIDTDDEHLTWLTEDEDVWGFPRGSDTGPAVLGDDA